MKKPIDILSPEFSDYADLQSLSQRIGADMIKPRTRKAPKENSKRARALTAIRAAAYHEDLGEALRIRMNSRIGHATYVEAVEAGRRLRARGVKCNCFECKQSQRSEVSSAETVSSPPKT